MSEKSSHSNKKDSISIVYHQRNDSPKYFEIKRSRIYLFFIGLPTITLIALVIGAIGIVNSSPFHLISNYKMASKNQADLSRLKTLAEENNELKLEIEDLNQKNINPAQNVLTQGGTLDVSNNQAPPTTNTTINSIGLSITSLFKPIQGQKDRTRPAILNLSGFSADIGQENVNFKFNIIPTVTDDSKISGHIIVLMKNELAILAYPPAALGGNDFQINYSAGELFSTQRFRPVEAAFARPKKSGNYSFTVFIFSRTGDLLHFQSVNIPLKI